MNLGTTQQKDEIKDPVIQSGSRNKDLIVKENRISIIEDKENPGKLTVIDNIWMENHGDDVYLGTFYTRLPDGISKLENGFARISESGEQYIYDWNDLDNDYYWDGRFVLLPQNFKPSFDFIVQVTEHNNDSYSENFSMPIGPDSPDTTHLYEEDDWGWLENGFYHGWIKNVPLILSNNNNHSVIRELVNIKAPPGLVIELYLDSNSDGILNSKDVLVALDKDFDGVWSPNFDLDKDKDGIPDYRLEKNSSQRFFVSIKAVYSFHFLARYQKTYQFNHDGKFGFVKDTLYETSVMRFFIYPQSDVPVKSESLSLHLRSAESHNYYYGEWSGPAGSSVHMIFSKGSERTEKSPPYLIPILISLTSIGVVSAFIIENRIHMFRNKTVDSKNKIPKGSKRLRDSGKMISTSTKQGAKKTDSRLKMMDTLLQLEEKYKAGKIDKESYEESRSLYMDYLKEIKK